VHVPVNAIGKNKSSVFFLPKLSLNFTCFGPSAVLQASEKSGAFVPTASIRIQYKIDIYAVKTKIDNRHVINTEERLHPIRELLERREIYRAAYARVALITGALSILTAAVLYVNDELTHFFGRTIRPREFVFAWIDIFIIGAIAAAFFLWRAARDNGDVFPSARTRLVLNTIAPLTLIPAAFTAWFLATGYLGAAELELVTVWIAFYGLICLACRWFVPRSVRMLGWLFLLTALSVPMLADFIDASTDNVPLTLMGLTFGIYHLVFAVLNWNPREPIARKIDIE
jgi:hypothetical protein